MKSLKPSMRESKRYLLLKGKDLKKNAKKAILDGVGVLGLSKAGFAWISGSDSSAVIAVNREALNEVRASFAIFPEHISVERVSGSLKNVKNRS